MKILFIGDIVGRAGRETVKRVLPDVLRRFSPDLVLANAENMSHGDGFSGANIAEMRAAGIDFFTSGNHIWGNKDGVARLDDADFPVIRPANFPIGGVPGRGYDIVEARNGGRVLVINLIGQAFMKKHFDYPLKKADEILQGVEREDLDAIFVDFHAEATSEKYALGYYLDGRVSAVVGTHTHVQTADARIFEKGTAYISDVGMTGPYDSAIGVKKELIIETTLTQMPVRHEPETDGTMVFSAVVVTVDPKSKKALNIERVFDLSSK